MVDTKGEDGRKQQNLKDEEVGGTEEEEGGN